MHQESILKNSVTKDLVTEAIQESLLNAKALGQAQLDRFVKERLVIEIGQNEPAKKFYDTLHLNKAQTFASLYEVIRKGSKTEKETVLQADRCILQRLIAAYQAGRNVNMEEILQHELMSVPLSLAETNGMLRSGDKKIIADLLLEGTVCPPNIQLDHAL